MPEIDCVNSGALIMASKRNQTERSLYILFIKQRVSTSFINYVLFILLLSTVLQVSGYL
jgi:hypothetical protein